MTESANPAATPTTPTRPTTAVDRLADAYFDAVVAASPMTATYLGVPGADDEIDDLSLDGLAEQSRLRRATLAAVAEAEPVDDVDRVTLSVLRERLGLAEETYAAGHDEMDLNVIASPLQGIRDIFDLMPTATQDDWATIARRMTHVPRALSQYLDVLAHGAARGLVAPRRQVTECVAQCADLTSDDGYFARFLAGARAGDADLSPAVRSDLESAVREAAVAYAAAGRRLSSDLLDRAPESDAAGRERYRLMSRAFLGTTVDLDETYAWGQEELARITAEMAEVAERITPGSSVQEAIAALDVDPAYRLHGTDGLRSWMQERADEAIAALSGTHFDIPGPVRTIECLIAPTQTGGIYYTGPSDDFARPGRMWWSVPRGVTEFSTWRELTTVYHEGVPGHHLQVGQTVFRRELLNRYRRMLVWCSGHGEGWALYAERLMAELGFMDDPGNRMGLLDGQSLRAARVVLDIGIHCGLPAPAEVGGGAWDYDKAWSFLTAHANMDEAFLRFELNRYLGWPGQAPAYKIGERIWRQLREEVAAREGAAFDIRAFHRRALDIGSTGLDTLREAVLGTTP